MEVFGTFDAGSNPVGAILSMNEQKKTKWRPSEDGATRPVRHRHQVSNLPVWARALFLAAAALVAVGGFLYLLAYLG